MRNRAAECSGGPLHTTFEWGSLVGMADLAGISGSRRLGPSSRFRMSMYALRRAWRPRSARTAVFLESSDRIPMEPE